MSPFLKPHLTGGSPYFSAGAFSSACAPFTGVRPALMCEELPSQPLLPHPFIFRRCYPNKTFPCLTLFWHLLPRGLGPTEPRSSWSKLQVLPLTMKASNRSPCLSLSTPVASPPGGQRDPLKTSHSVAVLCSKSSRDISTLRTKSKSSAQITRHPMIRDSANLQSHLLPLSPHSPAPGTVLWAVSCQAQPGLRL